MQFINYAIEGIAIASVCFFSVQLVLGFNDWRASRAQIPQPVSEAVPCLQPELQPEVEPVAPLVHAVVPFVRPVPAPAPAPAPIASTDWSSLDSFQLRAACQQRGIKWRKVKAGGKHLSKSEMVRALEASEVSVG